MNSNVKRKFNALLQGIGNRPSIERTDADNSPTDPASSPASQRASPYSARTMATDGSLDLTKKRRVGGPTSTPSKYTSTLQSSPASIRSIQGTPTTVSNVTLRKWASHASVASLAGGKDGPPSLPKYCPGDREQLVRRLATFQEMTDWTPKPDRVNEIEWAKRGWVCRGKERVRCTLCGHELVVRVNRKEVDGKEISVLIASEIEASVVDKYAELIVESHADDCLWRKKGCDDSLLRLPLPNPRLALQTLRQRYDELCERAAFLPYEFNLRLPPTLNLDTVLTHLPPTFFTDPPPPPNKALPSPPSTATTQPPINRPALALALLGWQTLTNPLLNNAPVPNSASCHTCLRRLGLWMFKSREVDPDNNRAILVPAPMDHLDPLREHRFFCPWKNAAAQRNPGAGGRPRGRGERERELPGWEVLVTGLRNEAFIRGKEKEKGRGRSKSSVPATGLGGAGGDGEGGPRTPERRPITAGGPLRMPRGEGEDEGGGGGGPRTPERRPITAGGPLRMPRGEGEDEGEDEEEAEEEDEEARMKKDKDMMSRLRRVKSLFNTKAGSKLRRLGSSRPGTSHSNAGGE
ncbi:zf-C3HC-domain-containing protein [Trichocladium antarcticum]|uniref:Zf-C3HC-domain-containing protein n=1 Tax=Trichocladium antarcticum TaxID=1450529 RepID=A0AAN6UNJ9_9PEZI|nr:zf-C3HC-domain-containing protein [Trichocladium antarcticum]